MYGPTALGVRRFRFRDAPRSCSAAIAIFCRSKHALSVEVDFHVNRVLRVD